MGTACYVLIGFNSSLHSVSPRVVGFYPERGIHCEDVSGHTFEGIFGIKRMDVYGYGRNADVTF